MLHLLCGGLAGCIAPTVLAPIDRTIILRQTKNIKYYELNFFQIIFKIYKSEGLYGLYKGNGVSCLIGSPYVAIEFYSFDKYNQLLRSVNNTDHKLNYLLSGSLAGITAGTIIYPLDIVRTLFAAQTKSRVESKYKGIYSTLKSIAKEQGITALYKGWYLGMIGIAPFAGLKLGVFHSLKQTFYKNDVKIPSHINMIFGGISGCVAVTLAYPLDLIRKRIQVQILDSPNQKHYNAIQILKQILKNDGIHGLYRGLPTVYIKLIPSCAISFSVNEKLKNYFIINKQN